MSKQPTVVIAHGYSHHIWGSEYVALETARAYRGAGWRPVFFLPGPGPFADAAREAGFGIRHVATLVEDATPARSLARSARVTMGAMNEGVDLLHATSLGPVRTLGRASRMLGVPLVAQLQTPYEPDELLRGGIACADLVLPVSNAVRDRTTEALRRLRGRPQPAVQVLHPPMPAPDSAAARRGRALRERWGIGPDTRIAGMAGQIIPRKGVDLFLRACAEVRRSGVDVRPLLMGAAPDGHERYMSEIRTLAERCGLGAAALFVGRVDDMPAHFHACDVLAVPSRREGLGLVAGEAMRCGVPVVASDTGGLRDLVIDGETGLLVRVNDADGLAAALRRVLAQPDLAGRLAAAGRIHVDSEFSSRRFASRLTALAAVVAGITPAGREAPGMVDPNLNGVA
jgi:glycosyltransferase involved in cell wall biosynthesis